MKNLWEIKEFNVLAGTSIEEAIKEALEIANCIDCIVKFNFNNVEMIIYNWSDLEGEIEYYRRLQK